MSYSRWCGSRWYTYWSCQNPATENRQTAIFDVDCEFKFSSKELREDMDGCIKVVSDKYGNVSDEEKEELKEYMRRFIRDVDEKYPLGRRVNKK